ncbi:GreA/GreB family elongation factor [Flavobacterium cucumis]|jgi:regulator of nucleoside diphosphate kinase|uniref:Regulator of nucleoside diphosphate kinase n=1 Tax=Flavobacterium cucumis TaxID=416016 RepID=A0A1M7ZZA8_9FLAO|nr:GreA/GreB family elongation factor [Flavobacterium cucumis]SHO74199.1 regulator of nucleoside diphosphate kinase [Flavobacterium cucumis]
MKPIPTFTSSDHKLLKKITKSNLSATSAKEINLLTQELDRGNIVEDNAIENDVIRINSEVIIEDMSTQKQMKFQIVLPSQANIKESKYSVLVPLSVAIIGFKVNDQVDWELPAGNKTLKVIAVNNGN